MSDTTTRDYFAEFWYIYPRRAHKSAAREAFNAALTKANAEEIVEHARQYCIHIAGTGESSLDPADWLRMWSESREAV